MPLLQGNFVEQIQGVAAGVRGLQNHRQEKAAAPSKQGSRFWRL